MLANNSTLVQGSVPDFINGESDGECIYIEIYISHNEWMPSGAGLRCRCRFRCRRRVSDISSFSFYFSLFHLAFSIWPFSLLANGLLIFSLDSLALFWWLSSGRFFHALLIMSLLCPSEPWNIDGPLPGNRVLCPAY